MAFEPREKRKSVSTSSIQFYNSTGLGQSSLKMGFWDNSLSISIIPALEESKRSEGFVFDYDNAVLTAIPVDKVAILLDEIQKEILPAIEENRYKSVSIPLGSNGLFSVSSGNTEIGIKPHIAYHKVNHETLKAESSHYYEFATKNVIVDYNEKSGEYNEKTSSVEFKLFTTVLDTTIKALLHAHTHSSRNVNAYVNGLVLSVVKKAAEDMGIESSSKSFQPQPSAFSGRRPQSSEQESVPVEKYDNVEGLAGLMNA